MPIFPPNYTNFRLNDRPTMPAIKVLLDERGNQKDYPIIVRLAHQHQRKKVATAFGIEKKCFINQRVRKHSDAAIINARIDDMVSRASQYFAECKLKGKSVNLDFVFAEREGYSFNAYLANRAKDYTAKKC